MAGNPKKPSTSKFGEKAYGRRTQKAPDVKKPSSTRTSKIGSKAYGRRTKPAGADKPKAKTEAKPKGNTRTTRTATNTGAAARTALGRLGMAGAAVAIIPALANKFLQQDKTRGGQPAATERALRKERIRQSASSSKVDKKVAHTQGPKTKTNVKENFDSTVRGRNQVAGMATTKSKVPGGRGTINEKAGERRSYEGHKKMSELTESAIGHAKMTAKIEAKMPKSSGTSLAPKGTNEAPKPLNTAPSSSTLAPKTAKKDDYSFEDKKAARTASAKPRKKATVEEGDYAHEDKRAARSADVQQNRYTKEGRFKAGKFGVFGGGGVKTATDKKRIAAAQKKRDNNRK